MEDTKQATDLVVLTIRRGQIAVRLRRPGYAQRYPWDFTIRYRSGGHSYNTEFKKIVEEGWADLFFYGHLGSDETIARWFLIDLDVFRKELETKPFLLKEAKQSNVRTNRDREQTQLISFDIRKFNPEILINSSHPVQYI